MINKLISKVKCDVKNCKNNADYHFEIKGKSGKFFICNKCVEQLCAEVTARRIPKSPANTIKRKLAERAKEDNYVG